MRAAWSLTDPELATQRLELLASELDRTWPDAAGSLREGMADTLTLMRLGITGNLAATLCSTNPCESMIEIVRSTQRNVKRWQDGDMRKRWTAAGMLVAEQQFRRIIGYRDLAKLVIAIERHATLVAAKDQVPSGEPRARYRLTINPRGTAVEVPRRSGQPRADRDADQPVSALLWGADHAPWSASPLGCVARVSASRCRSGRAAAVGLRAGIRLECRAGSAGSGGARS